MASSSQSTIAGAPEQLFLEWNQVALTDQDSPLNTQLILRPKTTLHAYIPQAEPTWTDESEITMGEFFAIIQD